MDAATLQSLIASGQLVDANGQPIQIIALTGSPQAGMDQMGQKQVWQLVQAPGVEGGMAMVAVTQPQELQDEGMRDQYDLHLVL